MSVNANNIVFKCGLFSELRPEESRKALLILLETSCALNRLWLLNHPETPLLYQSGLKYMTDDERGKRWDPGGTVTEDFRTIPDLLSSPEMVGDCDDLAPYRVAELNVRFNVPARCWIRWRTNAHGYTTYHVLVKHPDGRLEDPSRVLGMGRGGDPLHPFRRPAAPATPSLIRINTLHRGVR